MQSTVTRKNSYTLSINIKESGVELEKAKKHVIEEIRTKGKVKGFKQGSAIPDAVIIREYGEAGIESQALDEVVSKIYPKVLKKENINPIAPGNITEVKSKDPIELTLEVEVLPEIEIDEKKLDKIKVKRTPVAFDESEIDTEIDAIKARFTHFHDAGSHSEDGADTSHLTIEKNDRVTITAQGYDKKGGEVIKETYVPSYPLVIGSGSFIPGFEEKLEGSKVGDEVDFDITFPKDYHSDDFKGRKVHFIANIEKIDQIFREHAANLEQQGLNIKMYLEHVKKSEEGYKDEVVKPEADRRLKAELLLRKIRELKGTEATEDEVKEEVEKVIAQYGSAEVVDRLRAKLVAGDAYYEDIKSRVTYRKVVDMFWV